MSFFIKDKKKMNEWERMMKIEEESRFNDENDNVLK